MDWQTKEYLDERLDDLNEKMDLILEHLGINQDEEEDNLDITDLDSDIETSLDEKESENINI